MVSTKKIITSYTLLKGHAKDGFSINIKCLLKKFMQQGPLKGKKSKTHIITCSRRKTPIIFISLQMAFSMYLIAFSKRNTFQNI